MNNDKTHLIIIEKFGKYASKLELAMKANSLKTSLVKDIYIAAAEIFCSQHDLIGSVIGDFSHLKEADNSFININGKRNINCLSITKETSYDDSIDYHNSIDSLIKEIKKSKNDMDVRVTQEEMEALLAS